MKKRNLIILVLSIPLLMGSISPIYYINNNQSRLVDTTLGVVESKPQLTVEKETLKQDENTHEVEKLSTKEQNIEINIEVTAYCNCSICCGSNAKNYGLTTSGEKTHSGVIAIPKELKLNTKIIIPSFSKYSGNVEGRFTGLDRGGAIIKKNGVYVIDMWVNSHKEALKIGRVRTKGWIVKE